MEDLASPMYKQRVHIHTGHAVGNSKLINDTKTQVDKTKIQCHPKETPQLEQRLPLEKKKKKKKTPLEMSKRSKTNEKTNDGDRERASSIQRNISP